MYATDDEPDTYCDECTDFRCPGHDACEDCDDDICVECAGCSCPDNPCGGYPAHNGF
ncbi:hypothetical protein ACN20G_16665 [Streptomyces sp. BI20]|uniref:hypothetical protein n=1 Tax=Streptomyces sp. BI20 TaxID=3403460 RepID=UPI003C74671C